MLKLRGYQQDALVEIEKGWEDKDRVGVMLPTGMGKTVIFAHLTKDRWHLGRVLILVHRDELVQSALEKLKSVAPELVVGVVKAERNEIHAPVIVASVQTLMRLNRRQQIPPPVRTIIVDEAHHAAADQWVEVLKFFGAWNGTKTVGFSATMSRNDSRGLGNVWQEIVYRKTVIFGIRHNFLADVKGMAITLDDLDMSALPKSHGDYTEAGLGRALVGAGAGPLVAQAYKEYAGDRQGFVFTPNVDSAYEFTEDFRQAGISAATIEGATPFSERHQIYQDFRDKKYQTMINCMVLTEGFDMPQASCAVIGRPTTSQNLYIQMVGRVLRPWPGKKDALVLDVVGVNGLGLAGLPDLTESEVKEIKPGETITEAEDREIAEGEMPVDDLAGTIKAKDVNLFKSSTRAWLRTYQGLWFIPTRNATWFVFPENKHIGTFRVMRHDTKAGIFSTLYREMILEYAMSWAEDYAAEEDPSIASRTASWRVRKAPPTQKQMEMVRIFRLPYVDGMTKDMVSDLISVHLASRTLDPVLKKVFG